MLNRLKQFGLAAMILLGVCLLIQKTWAATGDFAIYRDTTGLDAIGTSATDISWDTTVYGDSDIQLQAGNTDIDLGDGGHYLVMYSVPTETSGGTNRSEMQSWIRNVTATTNYAYGWGQGYIRRTGGTDEGYNQGAAIINVAAGDDIRIQMQRTDSNTATVRRRANKSGISILKLDDTWDYARVPQDSDQAFTSSTFIDLALGTTTVDEEDTGTFTVGSSTITLKKAGHYLVTYNVSFSQNDGSNRGNLEARLTLDGTEIDGTRVTAYQRGTNSTEDGVAAWAGMIDVAADQDLKIQIRRESANAITGLTTTAAETGITIAKITDSADYVRLGETTGGQDLSTSRTVVTWDQNPEPELDTDSFGHDTSTNTERIQIDQNGNYLFFSSLYAARSATPGSTRETQLLEWRNSDTSASGTDGTGLYLYGGHGQYNRGVQASAGDSYTSGSSAGLILDGLISSQYVELTQINEAANNDSTYQAYRMALQGVHIGSLFDTAPFTQQLHYRWRDDTTDLNTSGGFLAAEDTAYASGVQSTTYRLRLEVANTGTAAESAASTYELQWGLKDTSCSAITVWTGVADASDDIDMVATTHITPDGESTTSGLLSNTEGYIRIDGEGRETADTTSSIGALPFDNYTELEYSIEATGSATRGATYCFRVYDTTAGTEIDGYPTYPELTLLVPETNQLHFRWRDDTTDLNTSGGFLAAEDSNAIGGITKNTTYRLRMEVANTGTTVEDAARTYELQWGELVTSCSAIAAWVGLEDSAADEFKMVASTHIDPDGESTTSGLLANTEAYTRVNGQGRDNADTTGSLGPLSASNYTELEYAFQADAAAIVGKSYCFRLYDKTAGAALDAYSVYPQANLDVKYYGIPMEWGTQANVDDQGFTTINFANTYTNPVFICAMEYSDNTGAGESDGTTDSVVCRVDNLSSTSVDVALQEAGGSATAGNLANAETVHFVVVESGTYQTADLDIEAFSYTSSVTNGKTNGWTAQAQSYGMPFTNPVVLTQVQTYNDTDWSSAYSHGAATSGAPDASNLNVGKHVAEDSDTTRSNETVGVVIVEQANDTYEGVVYESRLQGQTIDRIDDAASTSYTFNTAFASTPEVAIYSLAGVSGTDGPHPTMSGAIPLTSTQIRLAIMEDEIVDTEQSGNTEYVPYFVLATSGTTGTAFDQTSYRFYRNEDADQIQPKSYKAPENTRARVRKNGPVRLRMDLQVSVGDVAASDVAFKLQYAQSSDCPNAAGWTDVDSIGGAGVWRGYNNPTPADGATITASLLNGGTNQLMSYEESNNSVTNPNAIDQGERGEWDWVIQNNNAVDGTDYCFRMVVSDGTEINYSKYPEVTTGAPLVGAVMVVDP